jgi:TolB protein
MPRQAFGPIWVALAVSLSACGTRGIRVPQSPLLASLERKSGLIAFVGTDSNIYTIDQAGGNLQAITEDAREGERMYDLPTWAPVGNRLAYIGIRTPEEGRAEGDIYSTTAGGEPTQLYHSDTYLPFYLYWSPDGRWLSFLSSPGSAQVPLALQMAPAEGGEVSLLDTGRPFYWAWSPRERKVLVHAGGAARSNPESARLAFLDMLEPVVETGVDFPPANFQAPAFSPDGSHLLLAGEDTEGDQALLLTDALGAVQTSLTEFQGAVAFGWAQQGDFAAYIVSSRTEGPVVGDLSLVDLADPASPVVTPVETEQVAGFFWSPDGKQLAYFVPALARPAEGEATAQPQAASNTVYLQMHVVQARSGQSKQIATFRPSERFLNLLFAFDQYQRSATIWSPDSRYLVVPATDGQEQGLFIIPASGAYDPRFLTEGVLAFWSWE